MDDYSDYSAGVVIFWIVIILSIVIGIITKFWINTFLVGFVILPIISFIIIALNGWYKAGVERRKYTSRSMYCNYCHEKVIPSYIHGAWVWHCDNCGRSWKSNW